LSALALHAPDLEQSPSTLNSDQARLQYAGCIWHICRSLGAILALRQQAEVPSRIARHPLLNGALPLSMNERFVSDTWGSLLALITETLDERVRAKD
jgi:hypothetical protein